MIMLTLYSARSRRRPTPGFRTTQYYTTILLILENLVKMKSELTDLNARWTVIVSRVRTMYTLERIHSVYYRL